MEGGTPPGPAYSPACRQYCEVQPLYSLCVGVCGAETLGIHRVYEFCNTSGSDSGRLWASIRIMCRGRRFHASAGGQDPTVTAPVQTCAESSISTSVAFLETCTLALVAVYIYNACRELHSKSCVYIPLPPNSRSKSCSSLFLATLLSPPFFGNRGNIYF